MFSAFVILFAALAAQSPSAAPGARSRFCTTGLVTHVAADSFVLRDNDGTWRNILTKRKKPPRLGDVIDLTVRTHLTRFHERAYALSRFSVIGHGDVPPTRKVKVEDLVRRTVINERIILDAEVEDYFVDEADFRYYYLSLKSGPYRIYGTLKKSSASAERIDDLIGATIRLTGTVYEQHGARPFVGNRISIDQMEVTIPAEKDLSRLPSLPDAKSSLPMDITRLSRHRVEGIVLAVWQRAKILVRTRNGRVIGATLGGFGSSPEIGDAITVAGYPSTDFFNLSLVGARWQPYSLPQKPEPPIQELYNDELFTDIHGNHSINTKYHGATVRVRAKVMRSGVLELEVDLGRDTIRVYAGEESNGFGVIETGSEIELTGVAILESGFWREGMPFPRISGVSIVTRKDSDIVVLRHPPWWTPARILFAFVGLAVFIAGLIVWNRILMRLAARRSRELIREQLAKERSELKTDERTRLAIELHDSLSQNLSGLGCQLVATRLVLNADSPARTRLETAERMLQSTRTELKRCLFDLREDLLEDPDFERAVRTTLGTLLGSCPLKLRIHIARSVMDDSVAHAVLSIVRELVSNAIRHGHASKIQIAGSLQHGPGPTLLLVSVRDNGDGFDPKTCAGPTDGHFGLTGIRDRISRIGGVFHIESTPGRTYARFSIPV